MCPHNLQFQCDNAFLKYCFVLLIQNSLSSEMHQNTEGKTDCNLDLNTVSFENAQFWPSVQNTQSKKIFKLLFYSIVLPTATPLFQCPSI